MCFTWSVGVTWRGLQGRRVSGMRSDRAQGRCPRNIYTRNIVILFCIRIICTFRSHDMTGYVSAGVIFTSTPDSFYYGKIAMRRGFKFCYYRLNTCIERRLFLINIIWPRVTFRRLSKISYILPNIYGFLRGMTHHKSLFYYIVKTNSIICMTFARLLSLK